MYINKITAIATLIILTFVNLNAHAFFIIDFNEKWLREDACNRAMNQAKKNLRPLSEVETDDSPDVKTDILYTGSLVRAGEEFIADMDGVNQLSQLFPPERRPEAKRMFVEIIDKFNASVENLYQVPKENVATGLITLLGGAYAAYYNKPLPDNVVKPAFLQVASFLRKKAELFEGKSSTEMVNSYQLSVGLGMLLMLLQAELQKNPNPAHEKELKTIGRSIFQAVLGVEPERVSFTSSGIVFR